MTFCCKINNLGIRYFAQAITSCCKLGEDIYLDATPAKLTIKVLNEPYKSAFMMISFDNEFFETYDVEGRLAPNCDNSMIEDSQPNGNRTANTSRDTKVTCKLKTRSCLLAFKKEKTLAKNLDYCEIKIQSSCDFAQFKFTYNSKCVKTMDLPLGGDGLDVSDDIFQKGRAKITCKSRTLSDILTYFAKEDEYITMKAQSQSIDFETHFVDRDKSGKLTKTNIDVDELDSYNVTDEIFLTFSLRLIRPFLSFCSNRIPEIDIYMDGSNQPICFNAEFPPHIKIALALATLDVNHPNATRNSSRSSVMYQTDRSSQQGEGATENATRRNARFSSQHDVPINSQISNSQQSSLHSGNTQASWTQNMNAGIPDERAQISNEEQHISRLSKSRLENQQDQNISQDVIAVASQQSENIVDEDYEMLDDDVDFGNIGLDMVQISNNNQQTSDNHESARPTFSTIEPEFAVEASSSGAPLNSQKSSVSGSQRLNLSLTNGSNQRAFTPRPTSTPLPSTSANRTHRKPDDYWLSMEMRNQLTPHEEIIIPPTDSEDEDDTDEDPDSEKSY